MCSSSGQTFLETIWKRCHFSYTEAPEDSLREQVVAGRVETSASLNIHTVFSSFVLLAHLSLPANARGDYEGRHISVLSQHRKRGTN